MKIQRNIKIILSIWVFIAFVVFQISPVEAFSEVPTQDKLVQSSLVSDDDLQMGGIGGLISTIGSFFGSDVSSVINSVSKKVNQTLSTVRVGMSAVQTVKCMQSQFLTSLNNFKDANYWQSTVGANLIMNPAQEQQVVANSLQALNGTQNCVEAEINTLRAAAPATVIGGQKVQAMLDDLTKMKNTIDARRDELSKQLRQSQRGYWSTKTTQQLTALTRKNSGDLVKNTTNKFKITDFQKYTNSVSDLVYTKQAVRQAAPSSKDQFAVYSIITNPQKNKNTVSPAISKKAQDNLGFNPNTISLTSQNFYSDMAKVGASQNDKFFLQTMAISQADQVKAAGQEAARLEVEKGDGYKAPRGNCKDESQQIAINLEFQAINDKIQDRTNLLKRLKDSQDVGIEVDELDIQRTQQDLDQANAELENVYQKYESATIPTCDGLVAPADSVKQVVSEGYANYAKDLGNYNENALSDYLTIVPDVTNGLTNDLLYAGNNAGFSRIGLQPQVLGVSTSSGTRNIKEDSRLVQPLQIRGQKGLQPRGSY